MLLAVLLWTMPFTQADEKKDDKKDKTDKIEWVKTQQFQGKVTKIEQRKITLSVPQGKGQANVTLDLSDDVTVRLGEKALPTKFTKTGEVAFYSKDELKEMKGDAKLWGYKGDFDAVKANALVQVFVGKPKGAAKTDKPLVYSIYVNFRGD